MPPGGTSKLKIIHFTKEGGGVTLPRKVVLVDGHSGAGTRKTRYKAKEEAALDIRIGHLVW